MTVAPVAGSPEFHALRSRGVGASEIATVAGIGRWGSRWELWATKTGLIEPDPFESEAQRSGRRIERFLVECFEEDAGLYVAGEQMMVHHPDHPWMRATLDGLVFEGPRAWVDKHGHGCHETRIEDALGPVQLKETSDQPWTSEPFDGTIVPAELVALPPWLLAQIEWEIACCGDWCEQGWVYAKHPYGRHRVYPVARDEEGIAALFAEGHAFWFDHVVPRIPPALGGPGRKATAAALGRAFGEGGGGEIDVTDLADLLAEDFAIRQAQAELDKQRLDAENRIKGRLGDVEVGLVNGQPLVSWKPDSGRRYFDEKWHAVWAPDCHEQFVARGEPSRRLDVRSPCPECGKAMRVQDVEKHMQKHQRTDNGKAAPDAE